MRRKAVGQRRWVDWCENKLSAFFPTFPFFSAGSQLLGQHALIQALFLQSESESFVSFT
jgi:hypothetical protein